MKKIFLATVLAACLCLSACSEQKETLSYDKEASASSASTSTSSNTDQQEYEVQQKWIIRKDYQGDGSDLFFARRKSDDQGVYLSSDGIEVIEMLGEEYSFHGGKTYWALGEGLVFILGEGVFTLDGQKAWEGSEDYEWVEPFSEGLSYVAVRHGQFQQYGAVNTSGEWVIDPIYYNMSSFSDGLAPVCITDSTDPAMREYGFINAEGEVVYRGFQKAESFSEGLAVVQDKQTGLYGYIGLDGQYVIEPQYMTAFDFSEGLAAVALPVPEEKFDDKRFGYIDKNENWVLEPQYGEAGEFSGGAAGVTIGGPRDMVPHHLIDRNGEFITEKEFDSCTTGGNPPGIFNVTAFDDSHDKYLINSKGEEVFPGYY